MMNTEAANRQPVCGAEIHSFGEVVAGEDKKFSMSTSNEELSSRSASETSIFDPSLTLD